MKDRRINFDLSCHAMKPAMDTLQFPIMMMVDDPPTSCTLHFENPGIRVNILSYRRGNKFYNQINQMKSPTHILDNVVIRSLHIENSDEESPCQVVVRPWTM